MFQSKEGCLSVYLKGIGCRFEVSFCIPIHKSPWSKKNVVCSAPNSSEMACPNELKFLGIIPLGVQIVLGQITSGFD